MVYPCRCASYGSQYHGLGASMLLSNGGMGMIGFATMQNIEPLPEGHVWYWFKRDNRYDIASHQEDMKDLRVNTEFEAMWRDQKCKFDELWDI